jgi:hypothetical protein
MSTYTPRHRVGVHKAGAHKRPRLFTRIVATLAMVVAR